MHQQIIVSGASGFIGRHLVPLLIDRGFQVVAIARHDQAFDALSWAKKVRIVTLDINRNPEGFVPDAGASLVHLAWAGLPNYNAMHHLEENFIGSYRFVRALVSQGVRKVLVAGTCLEYGLQNGPLSAKTLTRPVTPYGMGKDFLRQSLRLLQEHRPFTLQWSRLFYLYGEGQSPHSLLSQLDAAVAKGATTFNMSGGEQLRDYLPVEIAAQQLADLFDSGVDGDFNICSGQPVSIRRLVEDHLRARRVKIKLNLGFYPYLAHEPMAFWGVPGNEVL